MHRNIVAAVTLLGLSVGLAGAALAAAPDSAKGSAKASEPVKAPAAKSAATTTTAQGAAQGTAMKTKAGQDVVVLETVHGDIVIKLFDVDAPKTAANFRKLVGEKFYDGTCFHRVIPGFMIQGGDPNSKNDDPSDDGIGGQTGPDGKPITIPAEIKLKHLRGSVATARQGDQVNPSKASSGSQFFIDLAPQPSLDAGGYTVFGEVISGLDVVDKIAALATFPGVKSAAGGGANPQKKALVTRAYLAPVSKYSKQASMGAPATTLADSTKK
jgi:peptidyl-prolyl cis-trans isomerase B (cyclophilin B)